MGNNSEFTLNVHQAAEAIGCSHQSVTNWTSNGLIPSGKDGHKRLYRKSDCQLIKKGIEEHGRKWANHVQFEDAPAEAEEESSEEQSEVESEVEERNTATKLRDAGNKLYANGHHEEAAELFSILVNAVDWSQLQI
jgi:DNA-binding transcriptional MerR regulator